MELNGNVIANMLLEFDSGVQVFVVSQYISELGFVITSVPIESDEHSYRIYPSIFKASIQRAYSLPPRKVKVMAEQYLSMSVAI